jgi:hypothetical protein
VLGEEPALVGDSLFEPVVQIEAEVADRIGPNLGAWDSGSRPRGDLRGFTITSLDQAFRWIFGTRGQDLARPVLCRSVHR